MKIKLISYLAVAAVLVGFSFQILRAEGNERGKGISKVAGTPVRTYLNINNISTVFTNYGVSDIDAQEANSGFVFPKGSHKTAVFESGFLWGGKVGNEVRVGGSAYRTGLQAGKIKPDGTAEDPDLPKNRIYRVRPDYKSAELTSEVADEGQSESEIRAQYDKDWKEWPVADGAPWFDVDGNGTYNPDIDIAGVYGADQTIWYVANDLSSTLTTQLYGANPIGLELQVTVWAYSQQGALGNMLFRKYLLINKSTSSIDSMYVSQWSDIDLGNSTDDYGGCDTTLSLGYVYNANAQDATYSPLPPPAVGFDFFQGPVVSAPGDSAIFRGKVVRDKKNLPMTAFYYFARGDATVVDPTQGSYEGTLQFYNFFQGRIGRTGQFFTDPVTNRPTTFALSGDPSTRKGWIDGRLLPAGDRRIGLASGPFTMAVGDTQEVVVAEIAAGAIPGTDRLSSIGLLKFYDQQAQVAYKNFFDLAIPPPQPRVSTVELDKEIVLEWGDDLPAVRATETSNSKGFVFQGYNVYQLPRASATIDDAKRVATYDIVDGIGKIKDLFFDAAKGEVLTTVKQFGNDVGLKRFISIKNDELRGGTPLINGIRYYFAVTAYNYNPDPNAVPNNLENPLVIFTLTPHATNPGLRYSGGFGDTVLAQHNVPAGKGPSDGKVIAQIVQPDKLTGKNYRVVFEGPQGNVVWHLLRDNGTSIDTVLKNETNQTGDDTSPIADGMIIRVFGPALDFKRFDMMANGSGPITQTVGYDVTPSPATNFPPFTGYSADWYRDVALGSASILDLPNGMQAGGGWFFIVAGGNTIADHEAALGRWSRTGARWSVIIPYDYEIRFTTGTHYAWAAFSTEHVMTVPFEIWNIGIGTPNDTTDDYQMIPWVFEEEGDDIFNFKLDHQASGGNNDPYSDWIYLMDPPVKTPGRAGYQQFADSCATGSYGGGLNETEVLPRVVIMNWNRHQGGSPGPVDAMPDVGTVFRVETTKPNKATVDEFAFVPVAPAFSASTAQKDISAINVFPNPYYGVNTEELNKYQKFVTFSHLPNKANIRIFNLAGVLVRTIHKSSNSQFERWNLSNEAGLPVASGIYIAHIVMPEIGAEKIIKIAIIQEQQFLDRF